jgi:dolichol-phosphate mannosyltransferase
LTENATFVTHSGRPALSVVVPTYNERERLGDLVATALQVFAGRGLAVELVIVDDNSPDGTGALADRLAATFPIRVLHRPGKLGLGSAVIDGFGAASAEVVGVMDADLSHPPESLVALYAVLQARRVDAVVGSRYIPGGGTRNWPLARLAMSRTACVLTRLLTPVIDATSGLFLVRRAAIQGVVISAAGFKICLELLVRGAIGSVAEVPYVFTGRTAGESKMSTGEALGFVAQLASLYRLSYSPDRRRRWPRYERLTAGETQEAIDQHLDRNRR